MFPGGDADNTKTVRYTDTMIAQGEGSRLLPEYLVVLTATITPSPGAEVKRCDPELRLRDYMEGLEFWIRHPHPNLKRILFIENSGAKLDAVRMCAEKNPYNKEVEFISVVSRGIPPAIHYGYGEMEMLDLALPQSALRASTTHMIKATGRLLFPSIGRLMDRLPESFDVCLDCRVAEYCYRLDRNPIKTMRRRGAHVYANTQLMIFSHDFYARHLQQSYVDLTVGQDPSKIERLIYNRLAPFRGLPGIFLRWPINVDPEGVRGHSNTGYASLKNRMSSLLRGILRTVAPEYWM
jgi:hypothetical protein